MIGDAGTCRGCGAYIRWVRMATSGKPNPLNPYPDEDRGNIAIDAETGEGTVYGAERARELREHDAPLYLSHFATCPRRGQFRGRRDRA